MIIQLHNDSTGNPIYISREAITVIQPNKDGRTTVMVGEDDWFVYVSETVTEALALWGYPYRGNDPVLTLKAVDKSYFEKFKTITAKDTI